MEIVGAQLWSHEQSEHGEWEKNQQARLESDCGCKTAVRARSPGANSADPTGVRLWSCNCSQGMESLDMEQEHDCGRTTCLSMERGRKITGSEELDCGCATAV